MHHYLSCSKKKYKVLVYQCIIKVREANLNCPMLPVVLKAHTIVTVLQLLLGYPLTVTISSLRCYSCHFGVLITQINLQPLINVICASTP